MNRMKISKKLNVATFINVRLFFHYPLIAKVNYHKAENRFLFRAEDEVLALLGSYPEGSQVYLHPYTGNVDVKNVIDATEWLSGEY